MGDDTFWCSDGRWRWKHIMSLRHTMILLILGKDYKRAIARTTSFNNLLYAFIRGRTKIRWRIRRVHIYIIIYALCVARLERACWLWLYIYWTMSVAVSHIVAPTCLFRIRQQMNTINFIQTNYFRRMTSITNINEFTPCIDYLPYLLYFLFLINHMN